LAGAKPAEWFASQNAGLGLVITAKSRPKPETSHSARVQAKELTLKGNMPYIVYDECFVTKKITSSAWEFL
jgi:hypothetical protein